MENKKLTAIGEALIDFIPDKTGCAFSEVTGFSTKVGGAPANVCGAFAKLGGRSMMITQLGDDPFGHKIADELAGYGIDTSAVRFTDEADSLHLRKERRICIHGKRRGIFTYGRCQSCRYDRRRRRIHRFVPA